VHGIEDAEQDRLHRLAAAGLELPLILKLYPDHYAVLFIFGSRAQSHSIHITYQKFREISIMRGISVFSAIAGSSIRGD
jgi:hypothetical protein